MTLNTSAPTATGTALTDGRVQVTEHHDARERDGWTADREGGKGRHTRRPVQRESDDQERSQIRADHRRGDGGGQT